MPCHSPTKAYLTAGGKIVFQRPSGYPKLLTVPCCKCLGCRIDYSRDWAVRCTHEAEILQHPGPGSSFVTLTYNNAHLPEHASLQYQDVSLFLKRLRKRLHPRKISYYYSGEYGEPSEDNDGVARPHYHLLIFGWSFPDKYFVKNRRGNPVYRSPFLEEVWTAGFSEIGNVTFQSAAYVARYVIKKREVDDERYMRVDEWGELHQVQPEQCRMSLKPAIGRNWLDKYWRDIRDDNLIVQGRRVKLPTYYLKYLAERDPEVYEKIKKDRQARMDEVAYDESDPSRLEAKRVNLEARASQLKRGLNDD